MKTSFNELKTRNILSKAEMQNVKGGASCGYKITYADGGVEVYCNKPKYIIDAAFRDTQTAVSKHWCCDSCATSTYCS